MNIIDSHIHLDTNKHSLLSSAVKDLNEELDKNKIEKGILIHMLNDKWTAFDFLNEIDKFNNFCPIINVNPLDNDCKKIVKNISSDHKIYGIKIHPRINNFILNDKKVIDLLKLSSELNLPVIIDAFPDGDFIMNGLNVEMYGKLAKECSETKIIWAHMGGHLVLDFLMISKRLQNVYFDFSYSLLYYRNSPILNLILYSIQNLKFDRVMFGSDYPDRNLKKSLEITLNIFDKLNLSIEQKNKIFYKNAKEIYNI